EPLTTGMAVCDDGGQRLIDFMSDRRRKLTHRCKVRGARQPRLRAAQHLFGAFQIINIGEQAIPADEMSRRVVPRNHTDLEPAIDAVRPAQTVLGRVWLHGCYSAPP